MSMPRPQPIIPNARRLAGRLGRVGHRLFPPLCGRARVPSCDCRQLWKSLMGPSKSNALMALRYGSAPTRWQ